MLRSNIAYLLIIKQGGSPHELSISYKVATLLEKQLVA